MDVVEFLKLYFTMDYAIYGGDLVSAVQQRLNKCLDNNDEPMFSLEPVIHTPASVECTSAPEKVEYLPHHVF